jgi:protein SCO1
VTRRILSGHSSIARAGARTAAVFIALLPGPVAYATGREAEATALRTSQAAIGRRATDHAFVDQDGRPLELAALLGRPLVVSFVFTNCYEVCSGLTLHLRDVVRTARETLGAGSFSVLTLGFDPAHDTPERMRAYGRDRGITDPRWHFVSGDAVEVRRFTDELGFTWAPSPRGFDHVAQVTILDAAGVVAQQVYGEAFDPPELVEPLKRAILRQSVERTPVRGLIDRIRLYCSVYDPATREYRFDYTMLAAGIPALLVFGIVALGLAYAARRKR